MSAAAAIDVLASTAPASTQATRKRSLDQRMQESQNVRLGQDGENKAGGKSALVNKMTSLYNSTKERNNGSVWSESVRSGYEKFVVFPDQLIAGTLQLVTDTGIITGGTYKRGTVLGMVTASGKYTSVKTATDGSETRWRFWLIMLMHQPQIRTAACI
jgi:hypothetical protein